jgi:O-antigen/teichoic acid export membrane protein
MFLLHALPRNVILAFAAAAPREAARLREIARVRDGAAGMISVGAIRSMFGSELGRKTRMYFAALVLNAVLGIVVYGMLTRALDVASFGTYAFVIAFFAFTGMFFDFGISPAGMRLLALLRDGEDHSRRIGALLLLSGVVGLLYALLVVGAAFVVDAVFHAQAGGILLAAAPLALVYPLQEMVFSISQGTSRMKLMSVFLVLPRLLLIVLLAAMLLSGGMDVRMAVLLTLAAIGIAVGMAVGYLRPVFSGIATEVRTVLREAREFGREVYLGRVVDGLTTGLDKILLSFFHGMAPVGFYSIAMTMSTPISMFSKAVSQSAYKRFVSDQRIGGRLLALNLIWCTAGAIFLLAACQVLIPLFFTDDYATSLAVLPWMMAGFSLAGLNHPFHAFLAAHRQGRAIRIMSITSSGTNIGLNFALIPLLGMTGAAIAFIATYAVNIVMNLHYYRRLRGTGLETTPAAGGQLADREVHG